MCINIVEFVTTPFCKGSLSVFCLLQFSSLSNANQTSKGKIVVEHLSDDSKGNYFSEKNTQEELKSTF
jgi:hypothetical protein